MRSGKASHLVEVEGVQDVVELAVLLRLLKLEVVLLKTAERQLCLIINETLEWLAKKTRKSEVCVTRGNCRWTYAIHELLACNPNLLA
jgi:hypothetical protein